MSASPVASPPHEALDDTEAVAPSSPTAEAPAVEDAPVEEEEEAAAEEAGSPAAAPAGGETLYNDVFGGDGSDLSDISDNDDDGARRSRKSKAADAEAEGGNDEDDNDGNDTYQPATATSSARIPSFKKNRTGADGAEQDGDDDDDAPAADEDRRRRKNKRKERRARDEANREEDEDEPVLDEATRRRLALEERIENIGKKNRVVRRKKKGDDVDVSGGRVATVLLADAARLSTRTTTKFAFACVIVCSWRPRRTPRRTRTSCLPRASWPCWMRS